MPSDKDKKEFDNEIGQVQMEVRLIKPGARYAYDVFDENYNLILEAHTPISDTILRHLEVTNIKLLYYDPSQSKKIEKNGETDSGLNCNKGVINNELMGEAVEHTRNLLENVRDMYKSSPGATVSKGMVEQSRSLVDKILTQIENNNDGIFDVITKLKNLDDYYYHHSANVSMMCGILASRLDFKPEIKSAMGVGGLFHDIGFSSVSKEILHKAELNDQEFDMIKGHTHVGYKFIEKNPYLHDIEKRVLLLHHERADGEGYPYGFDMEHYQNQIPREIRLAGLVDVYISLILAKPGEKALASREALRTMLNMTFADYKKEYHFLPADFRDFIRALGFIVNKGNFLMGRGDLVRLNTGEIGIIDEMNKLYPMNPKIVILKNAQM
jgi:HD-GYP domain-containing protein (c-di-GMP phosphodiesterase class II)